MTELFGVDITVDEGTGPAELRMPLLEIGPGIKLVCAVCSVGWRDVVDPLSTTGTLLIVASKLF